MEAFLNWLSAEHDRIMGRERRAIALLHNGDTDGYKKLMREKAEMLANIAIAAQPHIKSLTPDMAQKVLDGLHSFASSAAMSLKLNSVFYMSALLYRDDHKSGEPDNLEVYIRSLRENPGGANG